MLFIRNKYQKKGPFQQLYLREACIFNILQLIQNHRESFNDQDIFQIAQFISIDYQNNQFRCQLSPLKQYKEDNIRFVTKMQVSQAKSQTDKNKIMIIKEPIFSSDGIITFLLIFRWFPNASKDKKNARKNSLHSQKDINFKSKFHKYQAITYEDLIRTIYQISEKIYLQERFIDLFVSILSDVVEVNPKHINCITVVQKNLHKIEIQGMATTAASRNYGFIYQNKYDIKVTSQIESAGSKQFQSIMEIDQLQIFKPINQINRLKIPKSPRNSSYSNKNSIDSRILSKNQRQKQYNFNLKKLTKYFSAIECITANSQIDLQLIEFHLRDNKNIINLSFRVSVLEDLLMNWYKYKNFNDIYTLNKESILKQIYNQSLHNYKEMLKIQFESLQHIKVDQIYMIIKQLNDKTINHFLATTKQFIYQSNYQEYIQSLQMQINKYQQEMINNYIISKLQSGTRIIKDLQNKKIKKKTSAFQNSTIMKIIGVQQIGELDIGYRMYKKIIQSKLKDGFGQLSISKANFTNQFNFYTGNNDDDMLINIENRIQICQQKRKMLINSIQLSRKQGDTLREMMKHMEPNNEQKNYLRSQS